MTRMQKAGLGVIVLTLLIFSLYSLAWVLIARQISGQIDILWDSMEQAGATIEGDKPHPAGFPGLPAMAFQGKIIEKNGTVWDLPKFSYKGFPVNGFRMMVEMPQGMTISGPLQIRPVKIDELQIHVRLPFNLPTKSDKATLESWQKKGGTIPIERFFVKAQTLLIDGQGTVGLDTKLQAAAQINARVTGFDALLVDLAEKGILEGKSIIMAQSFLQIMMQKDPVTRESFFITTIRIQNHGVFLGPLRIATVPALIWKD